MNKKYIPGVIIVEGKHDVAKLSLIYESVFVITNGYEVPEKEIAFLKSLPKETNIIVLTDKDEAGKKIRVKINTILPNTINIEIKAPKDSKKKGIAECRLEDIQKELNKYVFDKKESREYDLYKLGLIGKENSNELKEKVCNKFNLGLVNNTNMIKRLNLLNITESQLEEEIKHATSK